MPDNNHDALNAHQTKLGTQIESLVKSVFLLSGIALTISIGLFNSPTALQLSANAKFILKISWVSFFASIIVLVISLSFIVFENYRFGMRWLESVNSTEARRTECCNYLVKLIPI